MPPTTQSSFFPVQCNRTRPKPPAAVDCDFVAVCDASTERYLCKGQSRIAHLPATEWICSTLARDIGLPVPPFAVVELTTNPGVFLFGSQWLGGAVDYMVGLPHVSNPELFSRVFGMDWVSHNDDRHFGNYLYLVINGEVILRPMDFSRAWLHHGWPLPGLPLPKCFTTDNKPIWEAMHGYTPPLATIDKVTSLADDWMLNTLEAMPAVWVTPQQRSDLIAWWTSPARQSRVTLAKSTLP
ncbi:HipA family kinase [Polaromonas sp. CT11-55]|uniref:HipA family kinase n=1 Tax=Polaromonas sp. CT11-55 TaxID=3243045 RepID=UPI0039A46B43